MLRLRSDAEWRAAVEAVAPIVPPGTPWDERWRCLRCGKVRNEAVVRQNKNNRKRGNRTSATLAAYLGGRNVEALKLPWDVEVPGARIQSKRLSEAPSRNAMLGYIDAITPNDALRAFFLVAPRQRLANGAITVRLEEWVAWHGWTLPVGTIATYGGTALLTIGVSVFRDWHVNELHGPDAVKETA